MPVLLLEIKGIDRHARDQLIRIVSMLTKLGQRNHEVRENPGRYDHLDYDNDNDGGAKGSR